MTSSLPINTGGIPRGSVALAERYAASRAGDPAASEDHTMSATKKIVVRPFGSLPNELSVDDGEITLNGLRYRSDDLRLLSELWGQETVVPVQVDPDNLEFLFFHDPLFDVWRRGECVQHRYARGLTLAAHLDIVEDYVRQGLGTPPWALAPDRDSAIPGPH